MENTKKAEQKIEQPKITKEQAIQAIDKAISSLQVDRNTHIYLSECLKVLQGE